MKTSSKYILSVLIVVIVSMYDCFGQNRIFFGKIIDAKTNRPISGIDVTLKKSNYSSVTDNEGFYKITIPENISIIEFVEFAEKKIIKQEIISANEINIYVSDFSEDEIYKLSLSELMNIKVNVASKVNEPINEAPAVVSVVTAKEIESYGATSLRDVLERVTSIIGLTGFGSRNIINMRGDKPLTSTKHILILINGRPNRECIASGEDIEVYGMFPINSIERIEVMRGPGSVLYGTNAFTGVINIVTKHESEYFSASISGGMPNSALASISGGTKLGNGILSAAVYYKNIRDWNQSLTLETKVDTSFNTHENGLGTNLSYYSGNFTLNTSLIYYNNFLIAPDVGGNYADFTRHFIDVGYTHKFSEKIKTSLNATNTYYYHNGFPLHPRRTSNDFLIELTNYIKPNNRTNLIFGGLINNVSGITGRLLNNKNTPSLPWYNQMHYNFYCQADYKILNSIKVIGGFQLNKYSDSVQINFIPRLGLIWNPIEKVAIKTLYAQAYRAPSAVESNVKEPRRLGNPKLKPEILQSLDLSVSYTDKKIQPSLTFFLYNQYDNIILDEIYTPRKFVNRGVFMAKGIEFEMKYLPVAFLNFQGSCSYQSNLLDDSIKNATTANATAKLGVTYSSDFGLSVGVFNIYNSEPPDVVLRYPNRMIVNPIPKAFNLLSANIDYNLSKILKIKRINIIFNVRGENILNEKIYTAESQRSRINSIPGKPGRIFYVGLKVSF
jgi:outer membrane receptor for ferrienterochelin and colicins